LTSAELLQQLIRFDTTNPPGNEAACVGFVRSLLEEAGCETQTYAKDPARPNLVARLQGPGNSAPLLLQGHVDVVTTAGQDWQRPPFGGELVDGEIWGRGARSSATDRSSSSETDWRLPLRSAAIAAAGARARRTHQRCSP
jgi:acetylornithine deacetylase/succinyl-diaminopimelate desuccinylase-like protein